MIANWVRQLTTTTGTGAITLGTDPRASDGLDPALDLPAAPPQPAPSVEAWFARPEWTGGGDGRYRSDWRAAYDTGQNTKSWRFEVATDVAGQATLSAEANAAVAAPCALLLIDRMSGRTHDLLADPVYTGKGLAGLLDMVRHGRFQPDEDVIFVHTGGSAGLFGYVPTFAQAAA